AGAAPTASGGVPRLVRLHVRRKAPRSTRAARRPTGPRRCRPSRWAGRRVDAAAARPDPADPVGGPALPPRPRRAHRRSDLPRLALAARGDPAELLRPRVAVPGEQGLRRAAAARDGAAVNGGRGTA